MIICKFESWRPSHAVLLFWRVGRLSGKVPIFRALARTTRSLAPTNSNFRAEKREIRPAVSVREFAVSVFAARGGSETHFFYTETRSDNGLPLCHGAGTCVSLCLRQVAFSYAACPWHQNRDIPYAPALLPVAPVVLAPCGREDRKEHPQCAQASAC